MCIRDRDDYEEMLGARGVVSLALVAEGRIVAFASGMLERGTGHVLTVNVHPERRGAGLGRRVLTALEARLAAMGARRLRLEVNVANVDALRLYEAAGYVRAGRLVGYYQTYEEPDAYVYEKAL